MLTPLDKAVLAILLIVMLCIAWAAARQEQFAFAPRMIDIASLIGGGVVLFWLTTVLISADLS